jgi:Zn-finger nucleic acid-binding protein
MHCPKCDKHSTLKPIKLNASLIARKCCSCYGLLIDLLSYRAWRDRWAEKEHPKAELIEVEDNSHALLCPNCSRIMLKFRIGKVASNTIDVCTYCDVSWLDEGEWELLGALALQSKLTKIFTEPWQRQLRNEQTEEARAERNEALVGKDTMLKVNEMTYWIESHPKREEVLRILRAKVC